MLRIGNIHCLFVFLQLPCKLIYRANGKLKMRAFILCISYSLRADLLKFLILETVFFYEDLHYFFVNHHHMIHIAGTEIFIPKILVSDLLCTAAPIKYLGSD